MREALVGLVILVGIAVTVIGTLWLKGTNFGRPSERVDVLVQEIGQLSEGNQVRVRGVPVGRVMSFEVEPGGQAVRILLLLDRQVDLPEDVGALIAPESLFGEWQVELVSRSRLTFNYFEVPPGSEHDGVPALGGFTMPDITRLTAAAFDISQNLSVLTDRVDRAFNEETADNIRLAIENIEAASQNVRQLIDQQATTFADFTAEVERAATEIGAAAAMGRQFLENADRLVASGQVDSILVNVEAITENLDELSGNMASATDGLDRTLARADSAFARVDRLSARVERGEGVLGQLMTDSVLVGRAGDVLQQLDLLLADLRENPKRYVRLSIF
ncbi:MAG: MCE family protein [Gemmatimonadetes bacterium]|nr:MCE family protein [Gemmatimonadota bacterium]